MDSLVIFFVGIIAGATAVDFIYLPNNNKNYIIKQDLELILDQSILASLIFKIKNLIF